MANLFAKTVELEEKMSSDEEMEKLWQVSDADSNYAVSVNELGQVICSLEQNSTEPELRDTIQEVEVGFSGTIGFEEFEALKVLPLSDRKSYLKLAFSVFDEDNSGQITAMEMRSVMSKVGLTDAELDEMLKEVDRDGDGSINFEEFCYLMPDDSESKMGYEDLPNPLASSLKSTATSNETAIPKNAAPTSEFTAQSEKGRGTSRLQMQIGLFRLLQGAAYRSFHKSFCANHETHLCVKNLPYRITDFVQFVKRVIELYKGLGVVEEACYSVLDAFVESLDNEYARLEERINNWKTVEKTPEMLAEEKAMLAARDKSANVKEKFAAGVELALTMKKNPSLNDLVEGVLAINVNRLRGMELDEELAPPPAKSEEDPQEYLKKWNCVILSNASEELDGAMMPVAYWYEEFMPKLLAACSVSTKIDIQSNTVPDEVALDQWYESTKMRGEFDRYGSDVVEAFPNCTPKQKLMLQQAWHLTRHYVNGVQKRRERPECGRESGILSQYVAFIDVYVGRTDVKNAQMRVSFPYYIGPAVWRFLHTTAEIVCTKTPAEQIALVAVFKDFFKLFANVYPCPYCRHHLSTHVVQNREVNMYPVEYLMLGCEPRQTDFDVSRDDKLSTVMDGNSLRLFFWKLHNAVSASIARSEEWYHKDEEAFYTTRYWPSLDSEVARAKALKHISIATEFIDRIDDMFKPVARLAGVKMELPRLWEKGDEKSVKEACMVAQNHIQDLEEAVISGHFLQETYHFDPDFVDEAPHFTVEEEEFARSGMFVESN